MQTSIYCFYFFGGPGPGVRGPFGRMGNVNWVILGFRPEKCTQIILGPRTSDFRPLYTISYIKSPKRQFVLHFLPTFCRFSIYLAPRGSGAPLDLGFLDLVPREAALAADLITA